MEFDDEGDDETLTAYHEAGHCVMAVVLGATIQQATMVPEDGRYWGSVIARWKRKPADEVEILIALAGPVAEMIYRGEAWHPGFVPEWSEDWKTAWQVAGRQIADEIKRLRTIEQVVSQLYRALCHDRNWAAIAAVSDRLLAFEEITHEEIAYEVSNWLM